MRSPLPWNMPCHQPARHWQNNPCRCQRHTKKAVDSAGSSPINVAGRTLPHTEKGVQILADVNVTLYLGKMVENSAGNFTNEIDWSNSSAHQSIGKGTSRQTARHWRTLLVESAGFFTATETFGATSDDLSVWEHAGLLLANRFELCVAIHTSEVQLSMISRANSLSAETVKECAFKSTPCSVKNFNVKTPHLLSVTSPT